VDSYIMHIRRFTLKL